MVQLTHITYAGPPADDQDVLERLPPELAGMLRQLNGLIQYGGGLHIRGACREPAWHSLRDAWLGERAFHRLYPDVRPEDVPFAEDCVGDQFLLREGRVWRLAAETGEVEALGVTLGEFFAAEEADPVGYLSLQPLLDFQEDGGQLQPGQLLSVYPPFCAEESAEGVTLKAVPTEERRTFLANLAGHLRGLPEGGTLDIPVHE